MSTGGAYRARTAQTGFTLIELLIVLAIMGVLLALIGVAAIQVKTQTRVSLTSTHMHLIAMALDQYEADLGAYPSAPFAVGGQPTGALADAALFEALTNRDAGGEQRGWSGAKADWPFLGRHVGTYVHGGAQRHQILDAWARPYYYIPCTDYLAGVRIHDPEDDTPPGQPNLYGATPAPDDFAPADRRRPPPAYAGPPPRTGVFHNPTTYQLISTGPDGRTDTDACDRGTAPDDIANF
jgi:prepilin-type N-terminal cleavage/methylation domain-containing protein